MNYNERLSGNEAIAFAMKQIDPDVMAAFPITPSTEIPARSPSPFSGRDLGPPLIDDWRT